MPVFTQTHEGLDILREDQRQAANSNNLDSQNTRHLHQLEIQTSYTWSHTWKKEKDVSLLVSTQKTRFAVTLHRVTWEGKKKSCLSCCHFNEKVCPEISLRGVSPSAGTKGALIEKRHSVVSCCIQRAWSLSQQIESTKGNESERLTLSSLPQIQETVGVAWSPHDISRSHRFYNVRLGLLRWKVNSQPASLCLFNGAWNPRQSPCLLI